MRTWFGGDEAHRPAPLQRRAAVLDEMHRLVDCAIFGSTPASPLFSRGLPFLGSVVFRKHLPFNCVYSILSISLA
jgi:hypothetical protein